MSFSHTLLTWYDEHKRALPWRGEEDPYKIWVSEIILQQTRVQQGWGYYLRFIETFPDICTLANASEEQVLRLWQGLGYYSRARNLHTAAQQIMERHHGVFPNNYEEIKALKGIGEYTAAAITSIAFGLPYPAIDGNVLRIISRIFGICEDISENSTRLKIKEICISLMDEKQPGAFNQAAMDFGSLQCTPQHPKCDDCPFRHECYAREHGLTSTLPIKRHTLVRTERFFHFTCCIYHDMMILEKRNQQDIWRNMYQIPLQETKNETFPSGRKAVFRVKELLTHQTIYANFYLKHLRKEPKLTDEQILVPFDKVTQYPMPKIIAEFICQFIKQ